MGTVAASVGGIILAAAKIRADIQKERSARELALQEEHSARELALQEERRARELALQEERSARELADKELEVVRERQRREDAERFLAYALHADWEKLREEMAK
ncbi:hypothetical protein GPECTOR_3g375 [Gonium pectorale]|uniref:Uncharacterized protein n=1 Tax=Gonium pectorale TaxID=33097 RepID=A0A150GZM6_GONPE|nr:hypothetical protein GPECTOR_3g375 [Gonium pectorale]|eukprot:KXZ55234.1 hypothetical protein GPECTOR_3g375 [Gonium pectorale]